MLKGNLMKEFPSTLSLVLIAPWKSNALVTEFIWAGDSRGYILDSSGLHQVTVDDIANTDALENLSEDAPMKNVISASHPYGFKSKNRYRTAACTDYFGNRRMFWLSSFSDGI